MSAAAVLTEHGAVVPRSVPSAAPRKAGFRPDIEGLRAVAVLLVIAFHAGVGVLGGGFVGVDVFFVISGFLITGLLVDEQRRTGALSLSGFYARRIRRLLPLGTFVLVVTVLVSMLVLPTIDRPAVADDATAAALWWANWHFAAGATDYMNSVDLSPLLHYWSLSVEEQFYVVWPLLILLVTGGGRALSWRVRRARLTAALLVLGGLSFLLSANTTDDSGPWAYFGLHTRAWELAAGGLLALAVPVLGRVPQALAAFGGWAGLTLVCAAAYDLDRTTVFPGTAAALPVGGTVLLLAAGARTDAGVSGLLARPWMTYVGRISYGWYLWHWPCLVLAKAVWGQPTADPDLATTSGPAPVVIAGAVGVSFLLAAATYRLVEQPVRESRTLPLSRPLTFALATALLVTSVGGAHLLLREPVEHGPVTVQTASEARMDLGTPSRCFVGFVATAADAACRFGDAHGRRVVVLLGDSHAAHWFPAMQAIAERRHWQLWFWAKPACAFADVRQFTNAFNREYTECATWRTDVMRRVADLPRVDAVVVGRSYRYRSSLMDGEGRQPGGAAAAALWEQGARRSFDALTRAARQVVLVRETPWPGKDVPACLSQHAGAPQACDFPHAGRTELDRWLVDEEQQVLPPGDTVHYVDMTTAVCPQDPCPVMSPRGAVVYRDLHHLTGRFSRELAGHLEKALLPYVRA